MDYSAKTAELNALAHTLLKLISRRAVARAEYEQLARHFYGDDPRADADSIRLLAAVVVEQLPNNPALQALAHANAHYLDRLQQAPAGWGQQFIREYTDSLGVETLFSQPILVGYAPRMAGSPFDKAVTQDVTATGWLMLYTTEGKGIIDTGVRKLRTGPGDLTLFEPGALVSYSREPDSPRWGHYWVAFQASNTWRNWLDWPRLAPLVGSLHVQEEQRETIQAAFDMLLDSYSHSQTLRMELNHTLLELLILRCQSLQPENARTGTDPRISKARAFIEAHYAEDFSVADVAAACALSASSLAHLFKQETGNTVMGWRDEKRMTQAARLLRSTRWPVQRVAQETGYSDAPYFSRAFKQRMGMTPRDYRRR
ncbi:MAG: arabinose operon transcriptional regulator AraC [Halieaceae bacterium]|nr:arabinose operon transcriptional regulator AraC [Halieaceae bacterium]